MVHYGDMVTLVCDLQRSRQLVKNESGCMAGLALGSCFLGWSRRFMRLVSLFLEDGPKQTGLDRQQSQAFGSVTTLMLDVQGLDYIVCQ
jgi:hypothetical protein